MVPCSLREECVTTLFIAIVWRHFAAHSTSVDTGGEFTNPAVLRWEGLCQIKTSAACQAIRHQCQCWVWANLTCLFMTFLSYDGRNTSAAKIWVRLTALATDS